MKRRRLMRYLLHHGCITVREGHRHTITYNPATGTQAAVPRHSEVVSALVREICKQLQLPIPREKQEGSVAT